MLLGFITPGPFEPKAWDPGLGFMGWTSFQVLDMEKFFQLLAIGPCETQGLDPSKAATSLLSQVRFFKNSQDSYIYKPKP
mmetsp:Transcript_27657/g.43156  ORF Transcript_27657/g.43156 Transcript_27657/m.43156 type:complete len:80 (+) Transcript_27657:132-371(+)